VLPDVLRIYRLLDPGRWRSNALPLLAPILKDQDAELARLETDYA
jgi:hypothetical protein